MSIAKELLDVLVCPKCKEKLELTTDGDGLDCRECQLRYPVRDDIPVMLVDEAAPLS